MDGTDSSLGWLPFSRWTSCIPGSTNLKGGTQDLPQTSQTPKVGEQFWLWGVTQPTRSSLLGAWLWTRASWKTCMRASRRWEHLWNIRAPAPIRKGRVQSTETLCFLSKPREGSSSPPYPEHPITDDPSSRVGCEPSFPPHATNNTNSRQQRCQHVGSPGSWLPCPLQGRVSIKPQIPIPQPALPHPESLGGGGWFRWACQVLGPGQLGLLVGRVGRGPSPGGRSSG